MLRAWIRLSWLSEDFARSSKNLIVVLSSTVSSDLFSTPFFLFQLLFALMMPGSALRIAMIVGGIPADLLNTVLCDSFDIRYSVVSSICLGNFSKSGDTSNRPTKISNVSAVIEIAPRCLN